MQFDCYYMYYIHDKQPSQIYAQRGIMHNVA